MSDLSQEANFSFLITSTNEIFVKFLGSCLSFFFVGNNGRDKGEMSRIVAEFSSNTFQCNLEQLFLRSTVERYDKAVEV